MSATSQGQKRRWVLRFRPELLYENLRLFLFIYAKLEINIEMSKSLSFSFWFLTTYLYLLCCFPNNWKIFIVY